MTRDERKQLRQIIKDYIQKENIKHYYLQETEFQDCLTASYESCESVLKYVYNNYHDLYLGINGSYNENHQMNQKIEDKIFQETDGFPTYKVVKTYIYY